MSAKRPTQKDVARRAGVSQATVSMAVSGKCCQSLSEDTLARIHSAAKELGYSPNRFAQALKTRRTMTVACIVPDITNPFYPELIRGVQKTRPVLQQDLVREKRLGRARDHRGGGGNRRQDSDHEIVPFASGNANWRPANEHYVSIVLNSIAGPENLYRAEG